MPSCRGCCPPPLVSRAGNVPYTPFKFTSAQQKFLGAARNLALMTTDDEMQSALIDGTVRDDTLPSLRWDERDNRQPATVIRGRVARPVGKEWLAFRGLTVLPPVDGAHRWPAPVFTWPLNLDPRSLDQHRGRVGPPMGRF